MGAKENAIKDEILKLGKGDIRLWNCPTGVVKLPNGQFFKFGMGKDSLDIVGFRSRVIQPQDVGKRFAHYAEIEVKTAKGRLSVGQQNRIKILEQFGALTGVARNAMQAEAILKSLPRGELPDTDQSELRKALFAAISEGRITDISIKCPSAGAFEFQLPGRQERIITITMED